MSDYKGPACGNFAPRSHHFRPVRLSRESSVPHLVSLVSCLPSRFARLPTGFALRTVTVGGGKQGGE